MEDAWINQIGATIAVHTGPYPLGVGIIRRHHKERQENELSCSRRDCFWYVLLYDLNSFTWKNRILHTFFPDRQRDSAGVYGRLFHHTDPGVRAPVWRIVILAPWL